MVELSIENADDYDIVEALGWEMDLLVSPQDVQWKAYFTPRAYDVVKNGSQNYIYEKDGQEFVKVWDNHTIRFIIHMRIAGIIETTPESHWFSLGAWREFDDGN